MCSKSVFEAKKKQAFVRVLYSSRKKYGVSYPRTFIVSLDKKSFYKVNALNSRQALNIVMSIGENPPPTTSPPPAPGKKISAHSELRCSATSISKDYAVQLLKRDLSRRKAILKVQCRGKKKLKSIQKREE